MSGFGGKTISSLLLGYTFIGLLGNFLGGSSAQRDVKTTLLAAILLVGIPVALLPSIGTHRAWVIAALAVWGIAYGAMPVALQMWMAKALPDIREGGMALFVANFQISIALGSFLGGQVVDRIGLLDAFLFGAVLSLVSLLILALPGRRVKRAPRSAAQAR